MTIGLAEIKVHVCSPKAIKAGVFVPNFHSEPCFCGGHNSVPPALGFVPEHNG